MRVVTDTGGRKADPAVVSSEPGGGLFLSRHKFMVIY